MHILSWCGSCKIYNKYCNKRSERVIKFDEFLHKYGLSRRQRTTRHSNYPHIYVLFPNTRPKQINKNDSIEIFVVAREQ